MSSGAPISGQPLDMVLVHGLWFRAEFMGLLGSRLEARGYRVHPFNYRTTRMPLERSARRLALYLQRNLPGGAQLVGHSLGGLLILRMLGLGSWSAPGRAVFLGTPLRGSTVARRALEWPVARQVFGHAEQPLEQGLETFPENRECGMIAGSRAMGLGRVTGPLERPNDGTVTVSETRHPGLRDHLVLPVTHTGMIYSREVARQVAEFLHHGYFETPGEA